VAQVLGTEARASTRWAVTALLAAAIAVSTMACGGEPGPGTATAPDRAGVELGDAPGDASPDSGTANLSPLGVAVIVDRTKLVLPDGTTYPLDAVPGGAVSGAQTRDGWLVRGFGNGIDTLSLWLISPTGAPRQMVDKADGPVAIAPDGRRIAWRSGGRLYYGHVDPASKAIVDTSSPAPERGTPQAVGKDSVVLGYSETGGGIDHHDVWFPSLGDYKPTWEKSAHVRAVFAPGRSDGTYLGLVRGPGGATDTCLAVMDPKDSLRATRTACGIVTQIDRRGAVSADGHWLTVSSASAAGTGQLAVIDLTSVFSKPAVATTWPVDTVGAWEDASNMLVASTALGGALVRFHIGTTSTTPDAADRPGVTASSQVQLLPRIG
jgi:hypothetical protein